MLGYQAHQERTGGLVASRVALDAARVRNGAFGTRGWPVCTSHMAITVKPTQPRRLAAPPP
jgi:hypothetical protein